MLKETTTIPQPSFVEEFMKPRRILITGNKGFIGTHLFERLAGLGHLISCADIKDRIDVRSYHFHEKYDVIFHLAADASIPRSFEDPVESHTHNVLGTLRILEYAKKVGACVVFSSSSSVYGEPSELPTSENSDYNPSSPYAMSKLISEMYCKFYWDFGVKSVALRYFNVFGEGQEMANGGGDSSLALANFLRQYKNKEPFTIVGSGEQRRDFVYVEDVVDANVQAWQYVETADDFQVFNVGSGKNYNILEITDMIDKDHPRVFLPPRVEPLMGLADITKAKTELGWEPKVSIQSWLEKKKSSL